MRGALYFIPALTTLLLALLTPLAPLAIDDVPGAFLPSPEEIVLWIVFLVASLALTC